MWETDGMDALIRDLATAPARVGKDMADVVRRTAAKVESEAKRRAPVQSGRLSEAIDTRLFGDGRESTMTAVIGTTKVPYAHLVEYGTSRTSPRPFLRPAFESQTDGFTASAAEVTDDLL